MSGIVIGAVVLVLFLLFGLIWVLGSRAKAKLAAKYPPPGRMVDVGGYRLHIDCQGDPEGSPTVVMDAGQGEPCLTWASVQPEVAGFTRVCTYDRAGLGWSERGPKPRTAANIVAELRALLSGAGLEPPYVLVGHSAGGLYLRLLAQEIPDQVAGMVLVDAGHEELDVRPPESVTKMGKRSLQLGGCAFRILQMLNSIGLLAFAPGKTSSLWFNPIPEEARETYVGVACSDTHWFEAARQEGASAWGIMAEGRAAQMGSLGDIPLIVLSRGRGQMTKMPGVSAQDAEKFNVAQNEMQIELAALSSRGRRIIAEESGHYIQVEQPELVIDAIREVVEAARELN